MPLDQRFSLCFSDVPESLWVPAHLLHKPFHLQVGQAVSGLNISVSSRCAFGIGGSSALLCHCRITDPGSWNPGGNFGSATGEVDRCSWFADRRADARLLRFRCTPGTTFIRLRYRSPMDQSPSWSGSGIIIPALRGRSMKIYLPSRRLFAPKSCC